MSKATYTTISNVVGFGESKKNCLSLNKEEIAVISLMPILLFVKKRKIKYSKNDEKIAKEVFLKNKNMILKLEDITVFKSNFSDKASNIKDISKILNLGLDSFVFVDDSKFECDQVKKTLPEVMTLQLPEDASDFIGIVESASPFYFNNLSKEDFSRVSCLLYTSPSPRD